MNDAINTANIYDFSDMEGIPTELADAIQKERTGRNQELYAAVVKVVQGAPIALGIKQVLVVLHKMGVEVPAESTVRSYLNVAHKAGEIGKPSRQSYWTADKDAGEAPEDVEEDSAKPVEDTTTEEIEDPLADLM